jgi:hypothetical protein
MERGFAESRDKECETQKIFFLSLFDFATYHYAGSAHLMKRIKLLLSRN